MRTSRRPLRIGFVIAVLATTAATLVRYALDPVLGAGGPVTVFLLAVVLAAWFGGFWPGFLATLAGCAVADFFFTPPTGAFSVTPDHLIRLVSFVLVGTAISFVSELWHRASDRESARARQLEILVASLRQSEELLRLAERAAGAGVWELSNISSGEARWSEQCHQLYGTDPATFSPTLETWLSRVHPEDRERAMAAVQTAIGSREEFNVEFRIQHPDLGERWLWEVGKAEYDEAGQPVRMAGITLDVTARKLAEERLRESIAHFRTIADLAPVKLWVTDALGQCTYLSPKWYAFSGRSPEQDLGLGWKETIHPEDLSRVEQAFGGAMKAAASFALDARFRRHDGEYRWMASAGVPRFDEAGAFLGFVGAVVDIHERKVFEQELKEADRRKDEFLATLAHELRNPLAPIRNGLHVMRLADQDSATVERARDMIDRQLGQMVRLIDDLLDVSRITSGKIELRKGWVSLQDAVQSAVETSRPIIDTLGQDLAVTLPSEPILLDADLTRIAQAFANLLQNAAKYSERGSRITVTARKEAGRVQVSVRDAGIGIPADLLPHVFSLFMQGDRARGRSQGGLGIGLTLVKRLIEMHGGTIEARSEGAGLGSEFVVTLPIVELPARRAPVGVPSARAHPVPAVRRRVLVVDDNEDSVESLAALVGLMGHESVASRDGAEALRLAATFHPDTILLDLGMPRMDGFEVCRAVRAEPWGARIILVALTGWGQAEDRARTREAGFDYHFVKPIEPVALAEFLARRLERSAAPS